VARTDAGQLDDSKIKIKKATNRAIQDGRVVANLCSLLSQRRRGGGRAR
jgi:hypothetical protein